MPAPSAFPCAPSQRNIKKYKDAAAPLISFLWPQALPAPEEHAGNEGDGEEGQGADLLHGLAHALIEHGCWIGSRSERRGGCPLRLAAHRECDRDHHGPDEA